MKKKITRSQIAKQLRHEAVKDFNKFRCALPEAVNHLIAEQMDTLSSRKALDVKHDWEREARQSYLSALYQLSQRFDDFLRSPEFADAELAVNRLYSLQGYDDEDFKAYCKVSEMYESDSGSDDDLPF